MRRRVDTYADLIARIKGADERAQSPVNLMEALRAATEALNAGGLREAAEAAEGRAKSAEAAERRAQARVQELEAAAAAPRAVEPLVPAAAAAVPWEIDVERDTYGLMQFLRVKAGERSFRVRVIRNRVGVIAAMRLVP